MAAGARPYLGSMRSSRITAAALLSAIWGCSELFTEPFDYGTVEVFTEQESGQPVSGVHLVLYSGTRILDRGESDYAGHRVFQLVPFGHLGVAAYSAGQGLSPEYQYITFRMREGDHQEVGFTFVACDGSVSAQVFVDAGAPVEGAEVTLYSSQHVLEVGSTDPSGRHDFLDVPCGNYGLKIQPPSGFTVAEGPGTSFFDGLVVENEGQVEVVFTIFTG